jgi:hypothetical protein
MKLNYLQVVLVRGLRVLREEELVVQLIRPVGREACSPGWRHTRVHVCVCVDVCVFGMLACRVCTGGWARLQAEGPASRGAAHSGGDAPCVCVCAALARTRGTGWPHNLLGAGA